MSFTRFDKKPLLTREQIALVVKQVADKRGLEKMAVIIALMTISVEVGANDGFGQRQWWCPANSVDPETFDYPHDSESDDNRSSGYFQQQPGPNGEAWWGTPRQRMTLAESADMFLDRLSDDYVNAKDAFTAGKFAQNVQGSSFPDRYAARWDEAHQVYDRAVNGSVSVPEVPQTPVTPTFFNEVNLISGWPNASSRNGRKPIYFVLHTSEGAGGMNLVNYMRNASVSYHYVVGDDGTVYDLVDTDDASWSVLDANGYTINLCFGPSFASWTRNEWLQNMGNGIKIAAYLAAQDCRKYNIAPVIRWGRSASGYPTLKGNTGITDHNGITYLGIGNHTDVGPNFPMDVFNQYLQQFFLGAEVDDMFSDADRALLQRIDDALNQDVYSRSIYREPNEGSIGKVVDVLLNVDGMEHMELVERSAVLGDEDSLRRVIRTASEEGAVTDKAAVERAKDVLASVPAEILKAWTDANK
ncbi:MAG: hypothetical protein A4E20_10930 [Nitrospira sp. SG-bin2]|uniref:N-acetylmuramoyl-L-alanine amidase n=1 Tax=Nitrospira cf. moscoviensis SBR1015 TaxID=96242 RepID=UPI000A0D83FC|nr:N-acetylmuramoyl-L-alanine amidase [Nitrospira cf. moscoviensis SBR1015]OQW34526.1 MAG: hypothetical protein A4E20_10930 [Nitrospira sp. SG-bin2]